jgi:hypothetical protein
VFNFFKQKEFCVLLVSLTSVTKGNSIDLGVINLSNKVIKKLVLKVILLSRHKNT